MKNLVIEAFNNADKVHIYLKGSETPLKFDTTEAVEPKDNFVSISYEITASSDESSYTECVYIPYTSIFKVVTIKY